MKMEEKPQEKKRKEKKSAKPQPLKSLMDLPAIPEIPEEKKPQPLLPDKTIRLAWSPKAEKPTKPETVVVPVKPTAPTEIYEKGGRITRGKITKLIDPASAPIEQLNLDRDGETTETIAEQKRILDETTREMIEALKRELAFTGDDASFSKILFIHSQELKKELENIWPNRFIKRRELKQKIAIADFLYASIIKS